MGVENTLMAVGCSKAPDVCNLRDFIKYTTTKSKVQTEKDPDDPKKSLKDANGNPITYKSNNWAVVD